MILVPATHVVAYMRSVTCLGMILYKPVTPFYFLSAMIYQFGCYKSVFHQAHITVYLNSLHLWLADGISIIY